MKSIILFPYHFIMSIIGFGIGVFLAAKYGYTPSQCYKVGAKFEEETSQRLGGVRYIFSCLLWMVVIALIYRFLK